MKLIDKVTKEYIQRFVDAGFEEDRLIESEFDFMAGFMKGVQLAAENAKVKQELKDDEFDSVTELPIVDKDSILDLLK